MRLGLDWLLTPQRAAVHVPTATAVLADLHLGYDRARQRGGDAIPAAGLEETLAALNSLVHGFGVQRLIVAGDLIENAASLEALEEFLRQLASLGLELAGIVPGNHDRALTQYAPPLPLRPDGITLGDWRVVHGDRPRERGRLVQGHEHPCLRWGGKEAAACYLVGARRLILPAFSADAAGVNVLGRRPWHECHCHVIAGNEVLDFGAVGTLKRRLQSGNRTSPPR